MQTHLLNYLFKLKITETQLLFEEKTPYLLLENLGCVGVSTDK